MPKLYLPSRLRVFADNQAWVEVKGITLEECLFDLVKNFPNLTQLLLNNNKLNSYTRLFLNNMEIFNLDSKVYVEDKIHIIQAMAGG